MSGLSLQTSGIKWVKPMKMVLYSLIPACISSVYFFGLRSLLLIAVVASAGYLSEYMFARHYRENVHSSVFVTCLLYTLTLPPTIPYWMAAVGIIAGVVFGKMVFGGFGRNVFNPALVGRAFIYVSFGNFLTNRWVEPFSEGIGGFIQYSSSVVTEATPLARLSGGGETDLFRLFIGNISGCLGETSALMLLIGGLFLIIRKVADYRIVLSGIFGMLAMNFILNTANVEGSIPCLHAILSGGFMLGIFFMATDPVSASSLKEGKLIYGLIIGVLTTLIRVFSIWPEGIMFAILIANMFIPIIDHGLKELKKRKKQNGQR